MFKMPEEIDITIIGAGCIGCAIAYKLSTEVSSTKNILVLEKNKSVRGENQSSRNSGVTHAGVYYPNKSKKAEFCVEGNRLLYEFCSRYNVPAIQCGKLIVATNKEEDETLDEYLERAINNGVRGIEKIAGSEAKTLEPNINAISALYVPTSGIIEPTEYVSKLHALASNNGAIFMFSSEVITIEPQTDYFKVTIKRPQRVETFITRFLINSAGLYSDEIAKMVNPESKYKIMPVRGEAAKFYKTKRKEINMNGMNVYPTPYWYDPETGERIPKEDLKNSKNKSLTLGIHLTPTFDLLGNGHNYNIGKTVTVGPTAMPIANKEDYGSNLIPEEFYYGGIKEFFPNLRLEDLSLHQAGIRAVLENQYDFEIEKDPKYPNCINLVGIDSPGLTSSLAIANYVVKMLKELRR